MQTVYLLHHVHELPGGQEDVKLIGVFSTEDRARAAIDRLKTQPGFRDHAAGFTVDAYTIDRVEWTAGFVTEGPGEG